MSSSLSNRLGLRNPPSSSNESVSGISRKRPATSISNSSINTSTANKRPQSHRMSIAMERLQLSSETMEPQRHSFVEPGPVMELQQQQQQQPLPMPRPSVFSMQNSRRASSIVRNPNTLTPAQKVISKFNSPDKAPPRRPATDMRLLKDPGTQRKYLKAIVEYLNESNYSGVPPPKNMRSLGGKDFQAMFRFFIEKLLPNHTYKKKFEDEAMDIIRDIQYPLIDTISPKDFLAIGALHSLPAFYALLHWLMQCCRQKDRVMAITRKEREGTTSLTQLIHSGRLFYSFSAESYNAVFNGNATTLDPQIRGLKAKFDQAEREVTHNIEQAERKKELLQREHEELLRNKPPLTVLKNQLEILKNDRAKFIKAGEDKSARIEKYKDQNARVQKEIDRMTTTREQMAVERDEIQANWKARGTSLEEIEQVEREHRQVNTELTEQSTKYEEVMRSIQDIEGKSTKAKAEIEAVIQEYNSKLSMIPEATDDMKVTYNEHGKDLREILNVDIENHIIPRLERYETDLRKQSVQLTEITLKQREELNDKRTTMEEKLAKLKSDKDRIAKLKEEYEEIHARAQEKNNRDNMLRDQYEAEKKAKRENIQKQYDEAKSRLEGKKLELNTVTQKVESEMADLKASLEIAEKEVRQALENMSLTTDNLKHEVMNCGIYNQEA